ncbi:hypothetical protein BH20CHL6_BH20CHL6_19400 [soil metagenome]
MSTSVHRFDHRAFDRHPVSGYAAALMTRIYWYYG